MSADLKPYPAMKDSGVEWLGDVPKHWTTERLKSSMHNIVEQTTERRGAGLYVALEHVESWTGCLRHAGLDVSFDSQVKCFRSGDVLFGKLRPYLAKVTRPTSDGICVGEFLVLRPRHSNATAPYMEQQLRSKPIIDAVSSSTFGAKMPRADWQFMGGMAIALPPLPEQAAIVSFIDHADRRIRRYIRAKQKLIALLKEQKQAIIHQAVTGQIDIRTGKPYQAYKSSGVEWFPEVPDHWNVLPMRRVIYSAVDGPHFSPTYLDTGIPFLSARNVKSDAWSLEDAKYISEEDYDEFNRRVKPVRGDVLYTKGGTTGVARVVDLTFPFQVWVHIAVLKVNKNAIDPGFLAAALNSTRCYEQSQLFTRGATNQDLGLGRMKGIELPVPPALAEQQTIVGYLRTGLGQVLEAISATHRDIGLLREYRTRLIADVVTGKLDVREAAARLPDEVEELEPLDEADALDGEEEPTDALATVP